MTTHSSTHSVTGPSVCTRGADTASPDGIRTVLHRSISELVACAPQAWSVRLERLSDAPAPKRFDVCLLTVVGTEVWVTTGVRPPGQPEIWWDHHSHHVYADREQASGRALDEWVAREAARWTALTGTVDLSDVPLLDQTLEPRRLERHVRSRFNWSRNRIGRVGVGSHLVMMHAPGFDVLLNCASGIHDFLESRHNDLYYSMRQSRLIASCDDAGLAVLRECMPVAVVLGDTRDPRTVLAAELAWEMWTVHPYASRLEILQLAACARAALA